MKISKLLVIVALVLVVALLSGCKVDYKSTPTKDLTTVATTCKCSSSPVRSITVLPTSEPELIPTVIPTAATPVPTVLPTSGLYIPTAPPVSTTDPDFNGFKFSLSWGVKGANAEGRNKIDTFTNQFTQDMIMNPVDVSTTMAFTEEEMKRILDEMKEIDIFNYPDVFVEQSNAHQTPFTTYKFIILYKGVTKTLYWDDENGSQSTSAVKLRGLIHKIIDSVTHKAEFMSLPTPQGGYV